jgi:hypothetical protein
VRPRGQPLGDWLGRHRRGTASREPYSPTSNLKIVRHGRREDIAEVLEGPVGAEPGRGGGRQGRRGGGCRTSIATEDRGTSRVLQRRGPPLRVGVTGFEPATFRSQTGRATNLRHTPRAPLGGARSAKHRRRREWSAHRQRDAFAEPGPTLVQRPCDLGARRPSRRAQHPQHSAADERGRLQQEPTDLSDRARPGCRLSQRRGPCRVRSTPDPLLGCLSQVRSGPLSSSVQTLDPFVRISRPSGRARSPDQNRAGVA